MTRKDYISKFHEPVLVEEVLEGLKIEPGKKYIDATLGGGGHTFEIAKKGGVVLGLDVDQDAIDFTKRKLEKLKKEENIVYNIILAKGNFADLKNIAVRQGFDKVYGVLFDLGMSSYQIDKSSRGFSFKRDERLDMRMDKENNLTAKFILNNATQGELYEIFTKYSEEIDSWAISQAIIRARTLGQIERTDQLVKIINSVKKADKRVHPATLIFQALRIEVNNELKNIKRGINEAGEILEKKGRLVVISYHSLEDRLVKLSFNKEKFIRVNKTPVRSRYDEILKNPRSRSAKLRIFEKL